MTKCCEYSNIWNTFTNNKLVRECNSCHRKIALISKDISPTMDKKMYKILNKTWNICIKNKYDYIEVMI